RSSAKRRPPGRRQRCSTPAHATRRTAGAWPTADAAPAPSSHDETTTQPLMIKESVATVSGNRQYPWGSVFRIRRQPGAGKTWTVDTHAPFLLPEAGLMPVVRIDLGHYGSEDRLVANLLESVEVRRWCDGTGDLCLVLDAFDEAQARIPTIARLFSHYTSQWPAGRLYLRITCRTAEWPPTLATAMKKAFGEVGTFELLPLRRSDVAAFLPAGVDVAAFLRA